MCIAYALFVDLACSSLLVFKSLSVQVNLTFFEMTIHLQNTATGAAFLKCNYWMRLYIKSSWLGYLLSMWETEAQCFIGLKILKSQFLTYQCRIFVSDYIMDREGKTLLTMPVCKMSAGQEKKPKEHSFINQV